MFSGYASLKHCVEDLEKHGHLIRVKGMISPDLDLAEVQRRAYLAGSPALLFENVSGTSFPVLTNLYGTKDRCRFIFRGSLELVKLAVKMKADPGKFAAEFSKFAMRHPMSALKFPLTGMRSLPQRRPQKWSPVMQNQTTIAHLPQIRAWPRDGGAFITLPQVLSCDVRKPRLMSSNLGMYRVQLSGNQYVSNQEVGLHYQIHRGLGVHHQIALDKGKQLPVSIFVGGPPAHTLAAVMPLPEGMSELVFAGMLADRAFRYNKFGKNIVSADADFCIVGRIGRDIKPEGPFGDHLGYYSLTHDFPVMKIDKIFHRDGAIWPATVVGRPPQEDTMFGELIHEIAGPMIPKELPGVRELHAVDAAGVHPLLLAIGSERYVPYDKGKPREILTQANSILGFNQCSLAKYLFIAEESPGLHTHNIQDFLSHCLERVDWARDLHFQTRTTMDTLDYSSEGLNEGSKVVIAAAGEKKRVLATQVPSSVTFDPGFGDPRIATPGILCLRAPKFKDYASATIELGILCKSLEKTPLVGVGIIVLCDDSAFTAANLNNFLWATFTRSNPSHDIYGVGSFTDHKHWGCTGALVIDARIKPHMAPPLEDDPAVQRRVDDFIQQDVLLKKYL